MAGVWDTATFVWNPGSAVLPSFNEVNSDDANGLTEGTFVSSPRDGRSYTGAQGSRFDTSISASPMTDGWTTMAVVAAATGEAVYSFWVGDKNVTNEYISVTWDGDAAAMSIDGRAAGGTRPGTDWLGGTFGNPRLADFGLHTIVTRGTKVDDPSANTVLMEVFVDGQLVLQSREVMNQALTANRGTVGRFDRSSPANSTGGDVFAAAFWPLPITDDEVQAVSYDPHSYPTAPAGYFYKRADLTGEWAGCQFFWTADHGEASGIDVVQGAIPNHADNTPADVEVTKDTFPGRGFGSRETYTMDLGLPLGDDPMTMMIWGSQLTTAGNGQFMALARDPDTNAYVWLDRDNAANQYRFHLRNTTGVSISDSDTTDNTTDVNVFMSTMTYAGTTVSVETFLNTILDKTTGGVTVTNANAIRFPQNISIGGVGDGSPSNGTDLEVYGAALWNRQLSDAEITLVLADPDSILSQLPTYGGGGGGGTAPTVEYGDTLLRYLQDQGATSKEVVGALNELNATSGVEFDLAYRTYFGA